MTDFGVFGEREPQRKIFSLDLDASFTYSAEHSFDTDKQIGTNCSRDSRDSEEKYKFIFLIDAALGVTVVVA